MHINNRPHRALYDTGADICCMSRKTFRELYEAGNRPIKLNKVSSVSAASGNKLESDGIYPIKFQINKKTFTYPFHVFSNLEEPMIMGINFFNEFGLGYNPTTDNLFWNDCSAPEWQAAALQCSETINIEPTSTKVITLNVMHKGYRIAQECEAVAIISSNEQVVQGGPALVKINHYGQTSMEIFNCTNSVMTIEKDSPLGIIERISEEDTTGELNVNTMTVNIEKQQLEKVPLTNDKRKYIEKTANLNVPENFRQHYLDLIMKHHEAINDSQMNGGTSATVQHTINLKDREPIYLKQFRIPEAQREAVQKHVEDLLKMGVVRPSRSKFNTPIFVISKQGGGLRIVQDFRAINQNTQTDKYSLKDIQQCISDIGNAGSTVFSTLDLTSGFWQMMLNPECRKYTAFTLPGLGQFEWNASPAGLLGAPGSFQKLLEIVIHNLKNILAHIDDLLVHTKDHLQHLEILDQLFTRLRKHGLKINLVKSIFGAPEMNYLGYKFTSKGVEPGRDKLKAIAATATPADVPEIKQFLGLCNFFRHHIRNFAQLAAPLTELTKRENEWKSGPLPKEAETAYQELKTVLISAPLVHPPEENLPYALITDACQGDAVKPGGFGAILAQMKPNGEFQVISYASRKLKEIEKNHAPFLLEMAASVWGMEHFSVYLRGRHFVLYTDHKPLVNLGSVHTKTLTQIQEAMLNFDFEIMYQKGSEMPADFLSRNVVDMVNFMTDDNESMAFTQNQEPWIKEIKAWMTTGVECKSALGKDLMKNYWQNMFFIEEDLLWVRIQYKGEPTRVCLVVPDAKVQDVLQDGHGTLFTGHEGVAKTKNRLTLKYWWPNMEKSITEFIRTCGKCQKTRTDNHPKLDLLTPLPICTEPNQRVHADLFGALVTSGRKKKYILCMTDACTKLVELVAIENKEAETVAEAIFTKWICRYGSPVELLTDQGKEFCNKLSNELCQLMEIKHGRTSAYHPQCNAQAEVANKTIAKFLRNCVDTSTLNWEKFLPPLMFSYNTSFHRTIQTSPDFLTFGQQTSQPKFRQENVKEKFYGDTTAKRFENLQQGRQVAWKNAVHQQGKNQEFYDRQAAPHEFHKDQWVLMKNFEYLHKNTKLAEKYKGPYKIIKMVNFKNVQLKIERKTLIVNVDRLKPYHGETNFQTFKDNFQKEGGDEDNFNFDFPPQQFEKDKEEKSENESEPEAKPEAKDPPKRKRGRPRKKPISDKDSEDETERQRKEKPVPTLEQMDHKYNLRSSQKREEENEFNSDSEPDTNDEGEGGQEESIVNLISQDIVNRMSKIEKVTTKQEAKLIKISLLSRVNPFITRCRKIIKSCPKGEIKKAYPNWNENEIINYWWSGDIYEGPDEPNLISLADNPWLPTTIFIPRNNVVPHPIEVNEALFENEDLDEDFVTPPLSPTTRTASTPTTQPTGSGHPGLGTPTPAGRATGYILGNIRPALRTATFREACQMSDFNQDEQTLFYQTFYGKPEIGRSESRSKKFNPAGLFSAFGSSRKK